MTRRETMWTTLGRILSWPQPGRAALLDDVVAACARIAAKGGPHAGSCDAAVRISSDHPADIGVLASLLFEEFRLYRLACTAGDLPVPGHGPRIVLCLDGEAVLRDASGTQLKHGRGHSCFLSAADGPATAAGPPTLVTATAG